MDSRRVVTGCRYPPARRRRIRWLLLLAGVLLYGLSLLAARFS